MDGDGLFSQVYCQPVWWDVMFIFLSFLYSLADSYISSAKRRHGAGLS